MKNKYVITVAVTTILCSTFFYCYAKTAPNPAISGTETQTNEVKPIISGKK